MVGRRVFFAAGERADCLKQDLQILGDFQDCRRTVDGWAAGLFCGGGKGRIV